MFEYGQKGLPHALVHAKELVETYGHHGACCTCVGEAGHKEDIKDAAKFARTFGDRNQTQEGMLQYVLRQQLWVAVFALNTRRHGDVSSDDPMRAEDASAEDNTEPHPTRHVPGEANTLHQLRELLDVTSGWEDMAPVGGRPPRRWGSQFLSKRLLIARTELINLLRTVLRMDPTWANTTLLATQLQWECYGVAELDGGERKHRKIVGISTKTPQRRDFVRLRGNDPRGGAALSAQVIILRIRCNISTYTFVLLDIYGSLFDVYVMKIFLRILSKP